MIDIRPINLEESEAFLSMLCEVFGLDTTRAKSIFYSEPLFDLNRKWALFEAGEMVSILTTTALEFGWGRAYGVAGVATRLSHRGLGYASKLLDKVFAVAEQNGEGAALLFAKNPAIYEQNGFQPVDRAMRVPLILAPEGDLGEALTNGQVRSMYETWAEQNPHRLRRDDQRWSYWKWHYRLCSPFCGGYICAEPGTLRECLYSGSPAAIPLPADTQWFGLESMAEQFQIPLAGPGEFELHLMAKNVPGRPQMFMTDQF